MDGERDPRNLRICFKIVPKIASRGLLVSTDLADGLFGVCSCYFPITFTPPPNDTVQFPQPPPLLATCSPSASSLLYHCIFLAHEISTVPLRRPPPEMGEKNALPGIS